MDKLVDLSNATLGDLDIARPTYDRSALTPGIVHIGVGNFHRAHQAWYLHRLMQNGQAHDWAILGAGVRPYDAAMREKLLAQDCLTTLIELDPAPAAPAAPGGIRGATGYRYWTIAVSNLVASVEKAAAAGATIVVAAKEVRPGITIAIIADPDGNWVELLEESA